MTKDDLYNYLKTPQLLDRETLPQLESLVKTYPYAGGLVFLYLYNLMQVNDIRYPSELQRLAVRLPSRELLFGVAECGITFDSPQQESPISEGSFALVEQFLNSRKEHDADLLPSDADILATEDYFAAYAVDNSTPYLEVAHNHEELDTLSASAQPQEAPTDQKPALVGSTTRTSPPQSDPLFTETLGRTYAKQGRFDQALAVFEAIDARNSEKSAFFAEQIEYLRILNENKKEE